MHDSQPDGREHDHDDEPPLVHDGMPIAEWYAGEPVPALDRIARERWREVLAPLRHRTRLRARDRTHSDVSAAGVLVGELLLDDGDGVARAASAPPPAMPRGALPARRGGPRQVNFRLSADEYARLEEVARLFAMRPTTLARALTVRGVDRALYEERGGR
jgi:hypothetical protein